jgi:hypothetical protein
MIKLLVTVGNADPTPVWEEFLVEMWSIRFFELEPGEDEMIKNFIKTLYLMKKPSKMVDDSLRKSRYAYLVDEVEKVHQKVSERKNKIPNVVGEHILPELAKIVRSMDNLTTDEMWGLMDYK